MRHQHISFIKSALRIFGYVLLAWTPIQHALVVLVFSEMIGIFEELGRFHEARSL